MKWPRPSDMWKFEKNVDYKAKSDIYLGII